MTPPAVPATGERADRRRPYLILAGWLLALAAGVLLLVAVGFFELVCSVGIAVASLIGDVASGDPGACAWRLAADVWWWAARSPALVAVVVAGTDVLRPLPVAWRVRVALFGPPLLAGVMILAVAWP